MSDWKPWGFDPSYELFIWRWSIFLDNLTYRLFMVTANKKKGTAKAIPRKLSKLTSDYRTRAFYNFKLKSGTL